MIIKSLELNHFRNYQNEMVEFNNNINVLLGKNAQGKTNMLESIFLCAIGKSPKANRDKDLITWNNKFSKVTLQVTKKLGNSKIEFYLFDNQKKAIKVNGYTIKKIGELMGEFNAVYFSPDELKLVKESPNERRRFMDISLSQFNKNYFYNLNKYNKILMQRNKLLKDTKNMKVLSDTISIWDEQLSCVGAKIILERINFIKTLKKYAIDIHKDLTNNSEVLNLSYSGLVAETEKELVEILKTNYKNSLEKDVNLGFTSIGPHRDDIKITVNNIDVRSFGSQGQVRTTALTLKLSELQVFNENLGEYPVLLLDDVLSELDEDRQLKLLNSIKNIQTIITGTFFDYNIPCTIYKIANGKIKSKEIKE